MTPAERRALDRLARQARAATPDLLAAILRAFRLVREGVDEREVARLLAAGRLDDALDALVAIESLNRALNAASGVLQREVTRTIRAGSPTMPAAAREVVVAFNQLDPRILQAIRTLDTETIRTLVPPVREAVRQGIAEGIRAGINPRQMARELTQTIGLSPNQEAAIRSFRAALEGGRGGAPSKTILPHRNADGELVGGRALRDGRSDRLLRRAIATKTPLTPAQIDAMVARYRQRMIAFHAETHARTAAIQAQKVGQQLAWQEAQRAGTLDGVTVVRRWVTNLDGRERDSHRAMHGAEAPLEGRYSNGQRYPGEGEYNCRCSEIIRVKRPAFALSA